MSFFVRFLRGLFLKKDTSCDNCHKEVKYLYLQHGFSFCKKCKDNWEVVS